MYPFPLPETIKVPQASLVCLKISLTRVTKNDVGWSGWVKKALTVTKPVAQVGAKIKQDVDVLLENQVVTKFNVDYNEAWVDPSYWYSVNAQVKEGITRSLASYCDQMGSTGRITIYDSMSGKKLAELSSWSGFTVY